MRRVLVTAEVALSLVLFVGAGLLVRSLAQLRSVDRGYESAGLLALSLALPATRYGETGTQLAFWDELLGRVRALPGVTFAAGTSEPPVVGYDMTRNFAIEGRPDAFAGMRDDYPYRAVTDGWFETLGLPVLRGRSFTAADDRDARGVVVVNEAMARRAWPGQDAVGRQMRFGDDEALYEVVGVVANVRHNGLDAVEGPGVYAPYYQKDWTWLTWMTLMVRTTGDPSSVASAVRQAVWAVDPDLPLQRLSTVDDLYAETLSVRRFTTLLLGAFAALAITLGLIGLYGVLSWGVAERAREIGVRLALGAGRLRVLLDVLAEGAIVSGAGIAIGMIAVVVLRGTIRGLLYELQPLDPLTLGVAGLGLMATCLLATLVPALRAMRVAPATALRAD
jgi:predicted permease